MDKILCHQYLNDIFNKYCLHFLLIFHYFRLLQFATTKYLSYFIFTQVVCIYLSLSNQELEQPGISASIITLTVFPNSRHILLKLSQEKLNNRTRQIIQQNSQWYPKTKRKLIHQITESQQLNQIARTEQNPYIYIKQQDEHLNNCFDRKQQNKNNDAYKKNWKKHSWNQADVVQKLTKVLQKSLKQQGNYFDRNNNKEKLFNSLNEYRYDDVKSTRNDDSCMSKYQGNKSFGGYNQGNFNQKFI
ncbi:Hypothetical_protein [Hexamita inflata]|uniref:Hypothetical_protein n=1 Tax=Hexamita inflata TaxID=28002 RepID=A0AA86UMU7_9EUKA|nr:Hypothetical protein HINF_LOCUS45287 [Hexamita inflata]